MNDHQNIHDYASFFREKTFQSTPFSKKEKKILQYIAITGLNLIREALFGQNPNSDVDSDIDRIISYIDDKFDLSVDRTDFFGFFIEIGFSIVSLDSICANNPDYYNNLTLRESLENILKNLIGFPTEIDKTNGFPTEFNFSREQSNQVQQLITGDLWYPYVQITSIDYNLILNDVIKNFDFDLTKGKLLFHGTSWEGAISIMQWIEIIERQDATDFGKKNFYVTDDFYTSYVWAKHNLQPAVVFFYVPNDFIDNLEDYLKLTINNEEDLFEWKTLVFKCRNPPAVRFGGAKARTEYNDFIRSLDSKDLISGPIFANPGVRNLENARYIDYDYKIPLQYSFKESLIEQLNQFRRVTFFMEDIR